LLGKVCHIHHFCREPGPSDSETPAETIAIPGSSDAFPAKRVSYPHEADPGVREALAAELGALAVLRHRVRFVFWGFSPEAKGIQKEPVYC
jgi:hypothetical protein